MKEDKVGGWSRDTEQDTKAAGKTRRQWDRDKNKADIKRDKDQGRPHKEWKTVTERGERRKVDSQKQVLNIGSESINVLESGSGLGYVLSIFLLKITWHLNI